MLRVSILQRIVRFELTRGEHYGLEPSRPGAESSRTTYRDPMSLDCVTSERVTHSLEGGPEEAVTVCQA